LQSANPRRESDAIHYHFKFTVGCVDLAKSKIASKRCIEKDRGRGSVAYLLPEALDLEASYVVAGNGNRSRIHVIEACQKLGQRALAGAVLTYDGNVLTCRNV
jgi:hypothetical protein